MKTLKIKKLDKDVNIPFYATPDSAGLDLCANEQVVLQSGERKKIKSGLAFEIPRGYFGYLRPRSSMASNHGITTCSSDVVDSDYRGEVLITMINLSSDVYIIEKGQRVAQMVIIPIQQVQIQEVDQLSETERGEGGHGSTNSR